MNQDDGRILGGKKSSIDWGAVGLVLILLAAALCTVLHDINQPFWFDEVITVVLCRLPNSREIWNALQHAADTNPPFFYFITRLARHLIPDDYVGYRLPALIGMLGTITCIYLTLTRKAGRLAALAGAAFILCTPLAAQACEARPRSLMIGCVACAVLAWQRIEDSRLYAVLTALSLGGALSLHYYAVLVWPAFLGAEASVWAFHRRFRLGAWASFVVGALPLIFYAKLLLAVRDYYGHHFWAQPSFTQMVLAQDYLFRLSGNWGLPLICILTLLIVYCSIRKTKMPGQSPGRKMAEDIFKVEEKVLVLLLLWLPEYATVAAKVGHGGMSAPYMLPAVLGAAIAIGYLTSKMPRQAGGFLLALVLMTYALNSVLVVHRALNGSLLGKRHSAAREAQEIETEADQGGLPLVISDGTRYLPMAFYAPNDSKHEIYSVSDPTAAVAYSPAKSDSVDLALLALRHYYPLQVEDFDTFVFRHREFILVAGTGQMEWLPARLAHDEDNIKLISMLGGNAVYRVAMKPD